MASTIVHECTHAVQNGWFEKNGVSQGLDCGVSSFLMVSRGMEADAAAHEELFLHDVREKCPELYARGAGNKAAHKAFKDEMDVSGDKEKAVKQAFSAWYDDDYYRGYYDGWSKDNIKYGVTYACRNGCSDLFVKKTEVSSGVSIFTARIMLTPNC